MNRRQEIRTTAELQEILDSWSDGEEDFERESDTTHVVILPPDDVDEISDTEELDDNLQVLNDDQNLPHEITGTYEIERFCSRWNEDILSAENENDDLPVTSSKIGKKRRKIDKGMKPKWSRKHNYKFEKEPLDDTETSHKALYEQIGEMSPQQLWELFIDEEVLDLIVNSTNKYAAANNCPSFVTTPTEIKTFLGVLYITGYHTLPQVNSYWSNRESLGCVMIKECMPRDRFKRIKQFFHVCDNSALDPNDKFSKVSPLNSLMNKKFLQFGVFSHNLSIDEQMIAYYGRHSCKMFIKGKPIRFGYKYWCLASDEGYLYQFMPYAGATKQDNSQLQLGERVVLSLLSHLDVPAKHTVTFDNFFTSHKLLTRLSGDGFFALGTVRENRTNHAPLMDVKKMRKQPRGTSDFCFDVDNSIIAVRWNDNSVRYSPKYFT